jgi:CRP-like cAMP-binding protein
MISVAIATFTEPKLKMRFLKQIRKNELFANLTDEEINAVFENVTARMVKKAAGKIVSTPNESPKELCIIIDGNIVMYCVKNDGKKEVVNSVIDGAMFGIEAGLTGKKLTFYAASARDTELLYIDIQSLMDLGTKQVGAASIKLYKNLAAYLSEKVIRLESNTDFITTKGMRKKIAKLVYEKYLTQGTFDVRMGMDRNQMAKFLNVSRPSMSREMIRMREESIIAFRKDAISITDIERLKKILGDED